MPPPLVVLCRCMVCCCPAGQGHNDPQWIAYEAMLREIEAERESRCDPAKDVHVTPHVGCIMR